MPTAVWTTEDQERISQSDSNSLTKWNLAGPRVLDVLIEWTDCGCAILRAEAPNAQNMILEGYRFGGSVEASMGYSIPRTKSLRFWNGNAFTSCIVQHYPHGSLEALRGREQETFPPDEERFLNEVHWRGSFPLSAGILGQRMAIMVGFEEHQPYWLVRDQMSLSWLAAQMTVSLGMADSLPIAETDPFVQASRFVTAFPYLDSDDHRLSALLRILCSGRGLGWQRAWLMRRDGESYQCETCAGGLTLEDWGRGAHYAASSLLDLTDEVAHDIVDNPRQFDGMYRACATGRKLQVDQHCFDWSEQQNGEGTLFVVPSEMSPEAKEYWKAKVSSHVGEALVKFEDDERICWSPFRIGSEDFVAVLTWSNLRASNSSPRIVETGVILAVASELLALTSTDGDYNPSERESLPFIDNVTKVLSWLNLVPLSREELELAIIRRNRLRFENSLTHRETLREQMLAARSRRASPVYSENSTDSDSITTE
ncbi:MAG: hypothetical protein JWM11_2827 [Planctomycetaceae bacterium]|nr:hypothetical protein [Planctomycetaceae bacterium]